MSEASGGLVIAIDTSTRGGSVAIQREDGAREAVELDPARGHGIDLMPTIARLAPDASRIQRICVSRGPGSYTGLRVGIATALGLARGTGAELVGIGSLEAHLAAAGELSPDGDVCVIRFAFGGLVYAARFAAQREGATVCTQEPTAIPLEEASSWCSGAATVLGDARALESLWPEPPADMALVTQSGPLAMGVLELGSKLSSDADTGPESVQPLYLRAFEAKNRRR